MTDLSTPNLKRLLAEATPGPWTYVPGEAVDERCIVNLDTSTPCIAIVANDEGSDCTDADLTLAEMAPDLAQEVLRMREDLIAWANDEAQAHNALVKRAKEAGSVGIISAHVTIYNRIREILGDHDE